MTLENYVVRVYRRGRTIPYKLIGIVEKVGFREKKAFTNLDELWDILNPKGSKPESHRKGSVSRRKGVG